MFPQALLGFGLLSLFFIPLEGCFALRPQRVLRPGWTTDVIYYVTGNLIGQAAAIALPALLGRLLLYQVVQPAWHPWVAAQPVAWQLPVLIFTADVGYYWAHRWLHTVPWLWRFHAIHHSSEQLDWLTTVRVHPVDQVFTRAWQLLPIVVLGFSDEAVGYYALFSAAIAFFIHANLRWRLRWLNWLLVTPALHHWHHADEPQAYNKNLAAQCALVDRLFGSFYLPTRPPQAYGLPDPVPADYLRQLFYPLTRPQSYAQR